MLGEYSWIEISVFGSVVAIAFLVDLFAHRSEQAISLKNAAGWSAVWIIVSLGFAIFIGLTHSWEHSSLYLTGYLLEKSLSVDNLFVFLAIFSSFSVRDKYQHRVLCYGIIGAVILRLIFVTIGASLIAVLGDWALIVFGFFVLWSALKMWRKSLNPDEEIVDFTHHWAVKLTHKFIPVASTLDGCHFFTLVDGHRRITPLFLCLVTMEVTDIMFAFDSIPAIIAITQETFLIYTSNIFAILGLRSMYFLLAAASRYLRQLEKAVIIVLVFIGLKMLSQVVGDFHISPLASLTVVAGILTAGILTSLFSPEKK
ncbi:MAG: tellurium resistance protein TerC [Candidatus Adiutrix intracellularis]|jgi:tellurite resistance protein TerC|nr:MAG: tellurium resistance protein TerC [Candidatus Adiutrix intracellularis]MDR2827288.1 TerC/Alx family metal homeostasis membrane protein [Candidatus Adiutrix intracellularis]